MQTTTSKLTIKYQATIPKAVRKILQLGTGDTIAFDIDHDHIQIRKAQPFDLAFTNALNETLNEWQSEADEEAYHDL